MIYCNNSISMVSNYDVLGIIIVKYFDMLLRDSRKISKERDQRFGGRRAREHLLYSINFEWYNLFISPNSINSSVLYSGEESSYFHCLIFSRFIVNGIYLMSPMTE